MRERNGDVATASEICYRRFFEIARDGMLLLDEETGEIRDANPFLLQMLDCSATELIGKAFWNIGSFKRIAGTKAAFRALLKTTRLENVSLNSKNGQRRDVEFSSHVFRDGQRCFVQCVFRDVIRTEPALPSQAAATGPGTVEELRRITRILKMISACNQTLSRFESEQDLLHEFCRIAIEAGGAGAEAAGSARVKSSAKDNGGPSADINSDSGGGYQLAWVGFANANEAESVQAMAQAGLQSGYYKAVSTSWTQTESGFSPVGDAISTGRPCVKRHILTDPACAPLRAEAVEHGYASLLALPLTCEGQTFGAFTICAKEPDAFGANEVELLRQLAGNLAFGIDAVRSRLERKCSQAALREMEASERASRGELESMMEAIPAPVWLSKDPACREIIGNRAAYEILGVEVGKNASSSAPEEERQQFEVLSGGKVVPVGDLPMQRVARTGVATANMELEVRRADGTSRFIYGNAVPLIDPHGNRRGCIGTFVDISERKRIDEALRESNEFRRQIIASVNEGIIVFDREMRYSVWNPYMEKLLGMHSEMVLGRHILDLFPEASGNGRYAALERALKGEFIVLPDIERLEASSNSISWGQTRLSPLRNAYGEIIGVIASVTDVTSRKKAEEALRHSEERYRLIVETAEEGIWMIDAEDKTSFVNPKMAQMLGVTVEEMIGRSSFEFMDEDGHELARELSERRRQGIREHFELKLRRRDGRVLWTAVSANPAADMAGRYVGAVRMVSDITARKQAEDQLYRSQQELRALATRLQFAREEESLRISREVHDELGQNLTALKMDLSWLRAGLAEALQGPFAGPFLGKIDSMSQLLSATVKSVRRICSELRPRELDDIGLAAAIEAHALDFQARSGIRCAFSLTPEALLPDSGRSATVFRIFQEIITNVARHAQASRVAISLLKRESLAVLEVQDNGVGFSESAAIDGKTLGILGMRERAMAIGGHVEVKGVPNRGTLVTVSIPLELPRKQPSSRNSGRRRRV